MARFLRNSKFIKLRVSMKNQVASMAGDSIQTERLLKFSFLFLVLCHTLSCVWFLVAKLQDFAPHTWIAREGYLES